MLAEDRRQRQLPQDMTVPACQRRLLLLLLLPSLSWLVTACVLVFTWTVFTDSVSRQDAVTQHYASAEHTLVLLVSYFVLVLDINTHQTSLPRH